MADITLGREDLEALETLIDRYSLGGVVNGLYHLCAAKADHLRSDWQDEIAAKGWDRDGRKLATCENKLEN